MKKILGMIIAAALLGASLLLLSSCGHVHTLSEPFRDNEVASTCTEKGSYDEVVVCTECEKELKRKTYKVDKIAHTFVDDVCSVCSYKKNDCSEGLTLLLNPDGQSYYLDNFGSCTDTDVIIGNYNGLPVTKIAYGALEGCKNIKSITIWDTVTEIESYAFKDCSGLESITLPSNLPAIN